MTGPVLDPNLHGELQAIGSSDIVVGIPSWNNAKTIGHVVSAVDAGLRKYFPERRSLIVNSDGGSKDGTPDAAMKAVVDEQALLLARHPLHPVHRLTTLYRGIPGKGSALRTIFQVARRLQAKACAIFDSDLRSITPEWVELLVRPVIEQGFDYVAPYYLRHKFDGTITNNIVFPLTRALYGRAIRQPIGGDFGFSGRLIASYLEKDVWDSDVARFGVDIWLTTVAVAERHRMCQAYLGAKVHDPKDPGADLSEMLMQVVGSVFDLMETYERAWSTGQESESLPLFGFHFHVGTEPVNVDTGRMQRAFVLGIRELASVYGQLFTSNGLWARLQQCGTEGAERGRLNDDLWAALIYDFALAHHRRVLPRTHLLKSLTPLYLGRVASFVANHGESSSDEVEASLQELCTAFRRLKGNFIQRWREPARKGGHP
ncbi:MAG: glycosyl transferase family 2 [Acidobacteria bacterium]|nr:glycosyl transferase family 2 [Acidobacteriota bacterium]